MKSCQVVIIGAGIAGLAAAKTLLDGGLRDIVILEAQEYAGGRICSVPLNGSWIETGAQWIHGQKNEVWKIAHKYDLLSNITSVEGEGPYVRDDGVVFDPNLVKEIDDIVKDILEECEDYAKNGCDNKLIPPSIGYHLRERFAQYLNQCDDDEETIRMKEELYDWHYRFQIIDNSCSALEKLSAKAWGTYVFSGGEDYVNFNGGYSSLIRVMVGELPSGVLHLNSPVVKVKWKQDLQQEREESETNEVLRTLCKGINGVHLRNGAHNSSNGGTHEDSESLTSEGNSSPVEVSCSKGMVYTADHVIVTCSLGCLKENHKTLFDPQLPQSMTQAIEDMGFATINKIFLDFKKPWWSPDVKGFQLIWSKNSNVIVSDQERSSWTRDLTGFDVVFGQEGVLVGWVGGKGAELVEEISELEISHHCTELLKKFTLNENIPLPQKVVRSQWHKNPYVRGGYSNSTSLCDASKNGPSDLLTPILCDVYCKGVLTHRKHPVVLLAGEAAHEHFFSTTHGAYETGQKQARIILDYLNSP